MVIESDFFAKAKGVTTPYKFIWCDGVLFVQQDIGFYLDIAWNVKRDDVAESIVEFLYKENGMICENIYDCELCEYVYESEPIKE